MGGGEGRGGSWERGGRMVGRVISGDSVVLTLILAAPPLHVNTSKLDHTLSFSAPNAGIM